MSIAVDGGTYFIFNILNMGVIDLAGGDASAGARIQLYHQPFNCKVLSSMWQLKQVGDKWKIINAASNTAMQVKDGSSSNGTPVEGSPQYTTEKQLWKLDAFGGPSGEKVPRYYT